jgi:CRP-like cAMP-binding protein
VAGRVKLSSTSAAGHELLITIAERGHSFGEVALMDGNPRSFDATALEDCEVLALSRASLLPIISCNPQVGFALMQALCRRARRSEAMIQDAVFLGLGPRLARQLLRLAEARDGGAGADLAVSQQQLAALVGVTRESVNKQLCAWQRAGFVALRRGCVTIRAAGRLQRICGEADGPPEPGPSPFRRGSLNSPRA